MSHPPFRDRIAAGALVLLAVSLPGPWGGDILPGERGKGPDVPPHSAEAGRRLFVRFDCVRCHSPVRGGRGVNIPPTLDLAGSRAQTRWMAGYLLDPKPMRYGAEDVLPDLKMPRIAMSRAGAENLAAYLSMQRDTTIVSDFPTTGGAEIALSAEGAALFEQYQCRGCHELSRRGGRVGPSLDEVGRRRTPGYVKALLEDPDRVIPGTSMKDFDLWEHEVTALTSFLMLQIGPDRN